MEPLGDLLSDPEFLVTLQRMGFTDDDLAAGRRLADAQRRDGTGLGPPATWLLDGSERHDSPGYRCHVCRDSGWVGRELPIGHPEFGRAVKCACLETDPIMLRERQTQRIARAGLDAGLQHCTLDTFERLAGTGHALAALEAVLEAHRTRSERQRWLVLSGAVGTGKSHLLAAAVPMAALLDEVRWANLPDLLAGMAEDNFAHADDYQAIVLKAPILILDEFGAAGGADWARERLERIVNRRWTDKQTTLFGLTVPFPALEAWSPRIASRLGDTRLGRRVELGCGDYRRRGIA